MYTSAELQLLRAADGGASLPGVDTPTGNQLPAASLVKANTLTTSRAAGLGYFYDPSQNTVDVYGDNVTLSGIDFGSMEVYITGSNDTIKNSTFEPANGGNWYSVLQDGTGSATIENSTFTGPNIPCPMHSLTSSAAISLR